MKPYQSLRLKDVKPDKVSVYDNHQKTTIEYLNIESSFDIETTSTLQEKDVKFAFMYVWTFGICDKEHIYYGRTWQEFIDFCKTLQRYYKLSAEKRLIVYVHNLRYEFQFMRKYFNWLLVFATDDRTPIKALCDLGIEFRDSYILSGYSLAKLADNLTEHTIKKLIGNLDYKLCRTEATELSEQELDYINNDVEILLYYINEQIKMYGDITKIPLTNTGRVRKFTRNKCLYTDKNHKKSSVGKYTRYRALMEELTLTVDEYKLCYDAFIGGFTHASTLHSGKLLKNVHSADLTSAYPYVCLSELFPMSAPIKVEFEKEKDFLDLMYSKYELSVFNIKFNGVQSRLTYESYLSESKCTNIVGGIINNGRIFYAETLATNLTNIDFKIMSEVYKWDSIELGDCYKFHANYLPRPIIESIIELYKNKTQYKDVPDKIVEYFNSKGMLNSTYGMMVTAIIRNLIQYDDEWGIEKVTLEKAQEQVDIYNKGKNRFLYYPWGIFVTAYNRFNIWQGILELKEDYIYSDTDSLKYLNKEAHDDFFTAYNKEVENKLLKMCDYYSIDFNDLKPKTIKGKEKLIGVFDYEGMYTHFKTLGAKRYLVRFEDGTMQLTCAGLSKKNGIEYLLEKNNNDFIKVFEDFNDDLYIPSSMTGKNTHTYIDDELTYEITDYQGNTDIVTAKSSIHLSECDFTLNISKKYLDFLSNLRQGYLYIGQGNNIE